MNESSGNQPGGMTHPKPTVRLDQIAATLDSAVRRIVASPVAENPAISTVALVEATDLTPELHRAPQADLVLLVGVTEDLTVRWLLALAAEPLAARPAALMLKEDIESFALLGAATAAGVALIVVDRMARWDLLLAAAYRRLNREHLRGAMTPESGSNAAFHDLAELAIVIAEGAGGMVTIERPDSSVLAYSPSDGTADKLRIRAILGREAPDDSMRLLNEWGVMATIQNTREVVTVPEHAGLGMRTRLVTGIHSPSGQFIGSIWLQEGKDGFSADAETVVRGGASAASRVLTREVDAPSAGEMMLQRVFGEHGGIDAGTAAAFLELPDLGDAAVIGITSAHEDEAEAQRAMAEIARMLRLHIGAFAPQSRFVLLGSRAYALLPRLHQTHRLREWAEHLAARFNDHAALRDNPLHIALVAPIAGFDQVAEARTEADRVLDATKGSATQVTSFTQSRTSVLLREAIDLLGQREELADPRIALLDAHDAKHHSDLIRSLRSYVDAGYNAREAARELKVHPNTLRYRLGRAADVAGIDLTRAEDRLLLALQLSMRDRSARDIAR